MRSVLRAISDRGPGFTYLVSERTTVGRAAAADVQLVGESVSRFHAIIERQSDGRHVIADLDSKAGLRVDGSPVRRAVLESGAVVEICGFRLRYEVVADDAPLAAVPKNNGFDAVRQTKIISVPIETPSPRTGVTADYGAVIDDASSIVHASNASPSRDGEWLTLLRDVVDLRALRDAGVHDSPRALVLATQFAELALVGGKSRRSSARRHCRTPVLIGTRRGADIITIVGSMIDVSAGGARICTEVALPTGDSCWLLVATGDGERSGIAFSSRVVWSQRDTGLCGVTFIGRPVAGPDVLPSLHSR